VLASILWIVGKETPAILIDPEQRPRRPHLEGRDHDGLTYSAL
jgi:hypothetical protein